MDACTKDDLLEFAIFARKIGAHDEAEKLLAELRRRNDAEYRQALEVMRGE